MTGRKATHLAEQMGIKGASFTRFDYRGHGLSTGAVEDYCIGDWVEDALRVLDLIRGPQVLVGSSMGAWLAFHVAAICPHRIIGIVGVAAAPDFVEKDLLTRLTHAERQHLDDCGEVVLKSRYSSIGSYKIKKSFVVESRTWKLLSNHALLAKIKCPVRLLHGRSDCDVPPERALELSTVLKNCDIQTSVLEGDHRFSTPACLNAIQAKVDDLLELPTE